MSIAVRDGATVPLRDFVAYFPSSEGNSCLLSSHLSRRVRAKAGTVGARRLPKAATTRTPLRARSVQVAHVLPQPLDASRTVVPCRDWLKPHSSVPLIQFCRLKSLVPYRILKRSNPSATILSSGRSGKSLRHRSVSLSDRSSLSLSSVAWVGADSASDSLTASVEPETLPSNDPP